MIIVTSLNLLQKEMAGSAHAWPWEIQPCLYLFIMHEHRPARPLKTGPIIWHCDQLQNWILQVNGKSCAEVSFSFKQYTG